VEAISDRVAFVCNGTAVELDVGPGESLLMVLRERLGITSVKDGCAPQGQCGCCTVLVDGAARVSCVTPVGRVAGRSVTTVEGMDAGTRAKLATAFVETGGSQCGFCTPGIVMRVAPLLEAGIPSRATLDRALAAHLCRCTGWQSVYTAVAQAAAEIESRPPSATGGRSPSDAALRAQLEGGGPQRVSAEVPLGSGGFADDGAPRDAWVAVPGHGGGAGVDAAGLRWIVAESLPAARELAASVQGRRTTALDRPPLPLPPRPVGGVRLATSWCEPAYLEPDASWCDPGGEPAVVLANGGAFGAKLTSPAPQAARELADQLGRPVRVVFSREDVVRRGPKRPPMAATAVLDGNTLRVEGTVVGERAAFETAFESNGPLPYRIASRSVWRTAVVPGPPVSAALRAVGIAERAVLLEGALDAAGAARTELLIDDRAQSVLLDTCVVIPGDAMAGARVHFDPATGTLVRVEVRVAAGDPLDEIVLRSYCVGAAHMALGWVLTESVAVDEETGEVLDLTIRSFGVIRAKDTPPIEITIVDDQAAPRPRASDAVFAAVAAATWNAVSAVEGARPETFPASETRAARRLRR
jgi:aerobic-type carbon monoxide dehydrogenase small subunit (CoxS/CutS family)